MINIDKAINEANNDLEDKIIDEMTRQKLRKEFKSKLESEDKPKVEVSTNTNYYRVLDEDINNNSGIITSISSTISEIPTIQEADQVRTIRFSRKDLLVALGFTDEAYHSPSTNDEIELEVTIIGREYPSRISIY